MTALPTDRRIERSKIQGYLLHPVNGRGKAAFFESFGFSAKRDEELSMALLEHAAAATVASVVASAYGDRFVVTGPLRTPAPREQPPIVSSVWQRDTGSQSVRLITAYPA